MTAEEFLHLRTAQLARCTKAMRIVGDQLVKEPDDDLRVLGMRLLSERYDIGLPSPLLIIEMMRELLAAWRSKAFQVVGPGEKRELEALVSEFHSTLGDRLVLSNDGMTLGGGSVSVTNGTPLRVVDGGTEGEG